MDWCAGCGSGGLVGFSFWGGEWRGEGRLPLEDCEEEGRDEVGEDDAGADVEEGFEFADVEDAAVEC